MDKPIITELTAIPVSDKFKSYSVDADEDDEKGQLSMSDGIITFTFQVVGNVYHRYHWQLLSC